MAKVLRSTTKAFYNTFKVKYDDDYLFWQGYYRGPNGYVEIYAEEPKHSGEIRRVTLTTFLNGQLHSKQIDGYHRPFTEQGLKQLATIFLKEIKR